MKIFLNIFLFVFALTTVGAQSYQRLTLVTDPYLDVDGDTTYNLLMNIEDAGRVINRYPVFPQSMKKAEMNQRLLSVYPLYTGEIQKLNNETAAYQGLFGSADTIYRALNPGESYWDTLCVALSTGLDSSQWRLYEVVGDSIFATREFHVYGPFCPAWAADTIVPDWSWTDYMSLGYWGTLNIDVGRINLNFQEDLPGIGHSLTNIPMIYDPNNRRYRARVNLSGTIYYFYLYKIG